MKAQKILPAGKPVIFVDNRELNSNVARHIKKYNALVREEQLEVADYICSKRVACERKTVEDFIQSITNQRIFEQLKNLSESYDNPVLIIEGNPELLFLERSMHPNTIRGALASIAVDYKIPIIWTNNPEETAAQIYWLAYREQVKEQTPVQIRSSKIPKTLAEQQEFLVAGLPGINSTRAKKLLKHFKTPERIFTASEEALKRIEGFGEKTAKRIKHVLGSSYNK